MAMLMMMMCWHNKNQRKYRHEKIKRLIKINKKNVKLFVYCADRPWTKTLVPFQIEIYNSRVLFLFLNLLASL